MHEQICQVLGLDARCWPPDHYTLLGLKRGESEQVKGLTTAASVWATSAIAIAAGLGRATMAIIATIIALLILAVLSPLERRMRTKPSRDEPEE